MPDTENAPPPAPKCTRLQRRAPGMLQLFVLNSLLRAWPGLSPKPMRRAPHFYMNSSLLHPPTTSRCLSAAATKPHVANLSFILCCPGMPCPTGWGCSPTAPLTHGPAAPRRAGAAGCSARISGPREVRVALGWLIPSSRQLGSSGR